MPLKSCAIVCVLALLCVFARAEDGGSSFNEIQKKIVSFKLENGLRVILYPRGDAPVISCVTCVKTGSVDEGVGITGIAHQLEHLAFKGTPHIGIKDYAAEKKVLGEIDALYDQILAKQRALLSTSKESLLVLLAKLSTGSESDLGKIPEAMTVLRAKWAKDGDKIADEDFDVLGSLVNSWAAKVREAETFVVQNQYSNVIGRAGGTQLNAFTSEDCTAYLVSLPSNQLETWASLESDRFLNLVPRQLEKEKQVVLEERRMRTESRPFGRLYENFLTAAFRAHPYGVPVIGHRSDILNYTRANVLAYFRAHYTSRNTVVAVVGDLDVEKARAIITSYFSKIPDAAPPEEPHTLEPPQDGERQVEVEFPAEPIVMVGYHIPERGHPDTPALKVLNELAAGGRSSRFYTALVKTKLALSSGSWIGPGERYPRLWIATAEPSEDSTPAQAEAALFEEIERLKTVPPSREELDRVLANYRMAVLRNLRKNLNMAIDLSQSEALAGDWRELFREIDAVAKVTPEQVTAVAAKYLIRRNRTVARLISTEPAETPDILGVPAAQPKPDAGERKP